MNDTFFCRMNTYEKDSRVTSFSRSYRWLGRGRRLKVENWKIFRNSFLKNTFRCAVGRAIIFSSGFSGLYLITKNFKNKIFSFWGYKKTSPKGQKWFHNHQKIDWNKFQPQLMSVWGVSCAARDQTTEFLYPKPKKYAQDLWRWVHMACECMVCASLA